MTSENQLGKPNEDNEITAAILGALATAATSAIGAAAKGVNSNRYWIVGEITNATNFDLKREHSHCSHGEWHEAPPRYIMGDTTLAAKYLEIAKSVYHVEDLQDLTDAQVSSLVKMEKGTDDKNFGAFSIESVGAGCEGVVVYDVEGYSLYICCLLDNPQGASTKKAGCSIISKKFFDKEEYYDDLDDLIDHIFYYNTKHTKHVTDGESATVSHGVADGTIQVSFTAAHEVTFAVEFVE